MEQKQKYFRNLSQNLLFSSEERRLFQFEAQHLQMDGPKNVKEGKLTEGELDSIDGREGNLNPEFSKHLEQYKEEQVPKEKENLAQSLGVPVDQLPSSVSAAFHNFEEALGRVENKSTAIDEINGLITQLEQAINQENSEERLQFTSIDQIQNLPQKDDIISEFKGKEYSAGNWRQWNQDFLAILGQEALSEEQGMAVVGQVQKLIGARVDGKFGPETRFRLLNALGVSTKEMISIELPDNPQLENLTGAQVLNLRKTVRTSGIESIFGLKRGLDLRNADSDSAYQERVDKYSDIINKFSNKYKVDSDYIKSIIYIESRGKFNASSGTGSFGVMQLTSWIYGNNDYGKAINPFNPQQAIERGVQFFSDLYKKYDGDLKKVATAYNQGESVVNQAIREHGSNWYEHLPTDEGKRYYGHFEAALRRKPWKKKEED